MRGQSLCSLALLVAAGCATDPAPPAAAAPGVDASAGSGGSAGSAGSGGSSATDAGSDSSGATGGSAGSGGVGGTGGSSLLDASDGSSAPVPGDLIDLSNWKLTLPVGDNGVPAEIVQPQLATFSLNPYFVVNVARDGVVFRAHAGGVTTPGSDYPRSELREMKNLGADEAAWSTFNGVHTLTATVTITHLPIAKPHVVAAQIHDASDDVIMVRLEGEHLFVEGGGQELGDLDPAYRLGTPFTLSIRAAGGRIAVFYDDTGIPKVDIDSVTDGCYFKIGAYTQSNPSRGDAPDAYGEVVVRDLTLTHYDVTGGVQVD